MGAHALIVTKGYTLSNACKFKTKSLLEPFGKPNNPFGVDYRSKMKVGCLFKDFKQNLDFQSIHAAKLEFKISLQKILYDRTLGKRKRVNNRHKALLYHAQILKENTWVVAMNKRVVLFDANCFNIEYFRFVITVSFFSNILIYHVHLRSEISFFVASKGYIICHIVRLKIYKF